MDQETVDRFILEEASQAMKERGVNARVAGRSLMRGLGIRDDQAFEHLKRLEQQGLIVFVDPGPDLFYQITEAGQKSLIDRR